MGKPKEMELAMQSSFVDERWNVSLQAWIGTKKAARRMMEVLKVVEEMLPDELPEAPDVTNGHHQGEAT